MVPGLKNWQIFKLPVSSIRSRLIVFLLLMMLPVLTGIYWYVSAENKRYTDDTINSYLAIGADVFDFSRQEHINTLLTISSALTRDWGFRNAFGAADQATIADAAQNLLMRSFESADMMLISDMQGRVIADTAQQGFSELSGRWQALMEQAANSADGIAEAVLTIADRPYQITVIPLFLPTPVAWIFAGFPLDQVFVGSIKNSAASDVSVLRYRPLGTSPAAGNGQVIASTLGGQDAAATLAALDPLEFDRTQRIRLSQADYGTLVRPLAVVSDNGVISELIVAVIQRSYLENEINLARLRDRLLEFSLMVVSLSLLAVILLARSFTRPILSLANRVRLIEKGDYQASAVLADHRARDELKQLDLSVTAMARGLAEREKMRDLLGKVVSPQIAAELMGKQIELGGEEREVTVLFADIRGFTRLSEQQTPTQTLSMLNLCFEQICQVIEASGGVVDKFTGDAVMALFGAPVSHTDDARRAAQSLLGIEQAMADLQNDARLQGVNLAIAIGVHTGWVVAGNMGSSHRMNYTVIGDAVNLASRLESLTRYYGVSNLVSAGFVTALGDHTPGICAWELDWVKVKGRVEATQIFMLINTATLSERHPALDQAEFERQRCEFVRMLEHYRSGQWLQALDILRALRSLPNSVLPDTVYQCYESRIQELQTQAMDVWDGVYIFNDK